MDSELETELRGKITTGLAEEHGCGGDGSCDPCGRQTERIMLIIETLLELDERL